MEATNHFVLELKGVKCSINNLEATFKNKLRVLTGECAKLFRKIEADKEQKELYETLCALKFKIIAKNVSLSYRD